MKYEDKVETQKAARNHDNLPYDWSERNCLSHIKSVLCCAGILEEFDQAPEIEYWDWRKEGADLAEYISCALMTYIRPGYWFQDFAYSRQYSPEVGDILLVDTQAFPSQHAGIVVTENSPFRISHAIDHNGHGVTKSTRKPREWSIKHIWRIVSRGE